MNDYLQQLSGAARSAVSRQEWAAVGRCAAEMLKQDDASAEGYFLMGMAEVGTRRLQPAAAAFSKALSLDEQRYDAAVELARLHCNELRNGDAAALLDRYRDKLQGSPMYLNLAGMLYRQLGMPEKSWSLYQRANELQPDIEAIEANLATTAVYLGKLEEAKLFLEKLLARSPTHQRNHLALARLEKAVNTDHIEQMQEVLRQTNLPAEQKIFIYYAIGKELEDLEDWEQAFKYFKMAGDAVASVADYDINDDVDLVNKIIDVCNADWLHDNPAKVGSDSKGKQPIFVVGLPRTGTTLTERIISSHSKVLSVGETQIMQLIIRQASGSTGFEKISPEMIDVTSKLDIDVIAKGYMNMLDYRLGDEPMFVDKTPFNIFYLGYIAKAFPGARIVVLKRNPMDSCFSMYKQGFTWAFKFSYTLDGLGQFYVAYNRLLKHWKSVLGDRLIELEYEKLVTDQDNQTRNLLDKLGLEFEDSCLDFHKNEAASATVSSVQVRQKIHAGSVYRWKNYANELHPLKEYLENAGIAID